MARKIRLEFKQYDGGKRILLLGHGAACVSLVVEGRVTEGIVLRPDEARALGVSLVQQARFAEGAADG